MADKEQKQTITVTFTNTTVIRILIFVLVALLIVGFISRITTALQLILISGFLALALNPVVSWISNILPDKSRVRATAVAYIAVIAVLIGFMIGIVVYSIVKNTLGLLTLIPLFPKISITPLIIGGFFKSLP